jgi:putative Holliday junction resolvase
MAANRNILALDVGERRVGVALANSMARLSNPHSTLIQSDQIALEIKNLIQAEQADILVIGLPKNLSGEDTDQTRYVREFSDQLEGIVGIPVYFEDEAFSSVRAKQALDEDGKPYKKEDVDALAACYILDDFIANNPEVING